MMDLIIPPHQMVSRPLRNLVLLLHLFQSFNGPYEFPRKKSGSPFRRLRDIIIFCFLPFFFLLILVFPITQSQQQGRVEFQTKALNLPSLCGPLVQWCTFYNTSQYFWCVVFHFSKTMRDVIPSPLTSYYEFISQKPRNIIKMGHGLCLCVELFFYKCIILFYLEIVVDDSHRDEYLCPNVQRLLVFSPHDPPYLLCSSFLINPPRG